MPDSLSPLQKELAHFCSARLEPLGYFLAGGVGLSLAFLQHRLSEDLDFFCTSDRSAQEDSDQLIEELTAQGLHVEIIRQQSHFCRLKVSKAEESTLIDLVTNSGPALQPAEKHHGISVASFQDLAVNKVLALNRGEAKDFVDLYLILKAGPYTLLDLIELAKVKSADFDDEWAILELADLMQNFDTVPHFKKLRLLHPLPKEELSAFFRAEAIKLLEFLRPAGD